MSWKAAVPSSGYRLGCAKPTGAPSSWLRHAISPAHSGATALVPPTIVLEPSTYTE